MTFNFAMQAMDQIINSAAKTLYMSGGQMGCPIVFRGPNGAAARVAAQHSQDYSSWYAHVPGLKVVAPYDAADAKGLLKAAIRDPNPVIFLENEIALRPVFAGAEARRFCPADRQGARSCAPGTRRHHRRLVDRHGATRWRRPRSWPSEGIEAEVIDLRTLRPLDTETIVAVGEEDQPPGDRRGRLAAVRRRRRDRRARRWSRPSTISTRRSRACRGKDVPMPYAANLEKLALPRSPKWSRRRRPSATAER